MKRALFLAAVLLIGPDSSTQAQDANTPRAEREAMAARLRAGDLVRVRFASGQQIQGVVTEYEWPELHLAAGTEPALVLMPEVEALWVRGRAARRGALIGAVVGLAVGGAMGLFVGEVICDNPDCRTSTGGTVATFGALGTAAGAGAGALAGLAVYRWHPRFP